MSDHGGVNNREVKQNDHLINLEYEIYWAIRIDDGERFIALGGDHLDLEFNIEVSKGIYYKPIFIAAVMGKI